MLDELGSALGSIGGITVEEFKATPSTILPFGSGSLLSWRVKSLPSPFQLRLNGMVVSSTGTRKVNPPVTTSYRLDVTIPLFTFHLAVLTLVVDTSRCFSYPVSENQVASELKAEIEAVDSGDFRIYKRGEHRVEVSRNGIEVAMRFRISIDDFHDPELDIDATLVPLVVNRRVEIRYGRFSVDVDWPWWVTIISLGVTKAVEEVLDEIVENRIKSRLRSRVESSFNSRLDDVPTGFRLHAIRTETDRVEAQLCPV